MRVTAKDPTNFTLGDPGGMAATSSTITGDGLTTEAVSTAVFPSTQSVWLSYSGGRTGRHADIEQRIYYCSAPDGKLACEKVVDTRK